MHSRKDSNHKMTTRGKAGIHKPKRKLRDSDEWIAEIQTSVKNTRKNLSSKVSSKTKVRSEKIESDTSETRTTTHESSVQITQIETETNLTTVNFNQKDDEISSAPQTPILSLSQYLAQSPPRNLGSSTQIMLSHFEEHKVEMPNSPLSVNSSYYEVSANIHRDEKLRMSSSGSSLESWWAKQQPQSPSAAVIDLENPFFISSLNHHQPQEPESDGEFDRWFSTLK